jgi:hypothetical protein
MVWDRDRRKGDGSVSKSIREDGTTRGQGPKQLVKEVRKCMIKGRKI